MKKYILAAVAAITALVGPSVGAANAQAYFNRGGPTIIDRLMGNGYYNPYAGYAAYPTYPAYNYPNYNYARRLGCSSYNRNPYGAGYYGAANPWANQWRRGYYHHHHRRW